MQRPRYPKSYHAAIDHLVAHGAWEKTELGRARIARALRELRKISREWAREEHRHILWIEGMMPVKPKVMWDHLEKTFPHDSWLCQCGHGGLGAYPLPENCPMCNFPLRQYFESMTEDCDNETD